MGKTSSANVAIPSFSNGSVSLNGENKSSVTKSGNTVNSNYNMNDYEKAVYNYAQKTLAETLPNLNTFNSSTLKDLNSQVEAYKNKALQTLDSLYKPMIKNMTNDVASRFGNIDNSMFLNNLNSIENNRANAMANLAQELQSYKSELYNNELNNRYNYINLLNTLLNGSNNNALNFISSALSNSNAGTSYNQNVASMLNSANNSTVGLSNLASLASLLKYVV
ncbi:hypothetical protein IJ818_04285 [bacterium]|nr:hypothetical protein [bacterium]